MAEILTDLNGEHTVECPIKLISKELKNEELARKRWFVELALRTRGPVLYSEYVSERRRHHDCL